jgi:c-di-AMP phosphodiesterase-like protein
LVTELVHYFDDNLEFSSVEATALYAGLIVDTKNFAVQTGERTFEAAALLRRSGADPSSGTAAL